MQEYYFLFALGLVWALFGAVQDFRTREVANWLNFSLVGFALAYRAFYSLNGGGIMFFVSGLVGFLAFFVLGHLFYYGRAFGGGDVKMLYGFGVILPYSDFTGLLYWGIAFVFALFFLGSLWSLVYSVSIVKKYWKKFRKEIRKMLKKSKWLFIIVLLFVVLMLMVFDFTYWLLLFGFMIFVLFLYFYVKALDVCMLIRKKPGELQVGDWLESDVKIGRKFVRKSVHGLSEEEIKVLKKAKKSVLIKDGIPFTVSFLLALLAMGYVYLVLEVSLPSVFPF